MTPNQKPLFAVAVAAAAALFAGPATAEDRLTARAVDALGYAIAAQGDAALVQIREELKEALLERVRPYLPAQRAASEPPKAGVPADRPSAQR